LEIRDVNRFGLFVLRPSDQASTFWTIDAASRCILGWVLG
jgi:hypothetical protein